ncbi:hypothetical protein [Cellulomonas denverensis]|uniref:Uncharacterized protein n=1 Tax=Cellulomonas denverensis TaxID=264297 RepID=A0A7X6KTV3_9CELL|nr:hypothetical protein [Cellulomonas denverensis]NKY22201.1 hypothetical protein [Cellulomonas denverensis]GIG27165.1 hypothetical protein Cde04nite_34090 [Cellulomonas denverensis]
MSTEITAEHIARQIHGSLHEDYEGFTIDETSVRSPMVAPGCIQVTGYVGDDPDVELSFTLKVEALNVIDYSSDNNPEMA